MQGTKFEDGVWAVIHSGSRKYIGRLSDWIKPTAELISEVSDGKPQKLAPAFELHTGMMPIMTQQGPAMQHVVQVLPIDGAKGPTTVHVMIDALHLFAEMQEEDAERHKNLVMSFMDQVQQARAAKSGITLAKAMPGGRGGPRLS